MVAFGTGRASVRGQLARLAMQGVVAPLGLGYTAEEMPGKASRRPAQAKTAGKGPAAAVCRREEEQELSSWKLRHGQCLGRALHTPWASWETGRGKEG